MDTELVAAAQAGDDGAFRDLTEPHRRELQVHCYRMLGSVQDAEDAVQETLLAAWRGIGGFRSDASVRTWLYRIATNRCLNVLRSASRRPTKEWDMSGPEPPLPSSPAAEIAWLEPWPDDSVLPRGPGPLGPEARAEQSESMSLAFLTALQALPARQRAVLILREVLGFRATEVAEMLDATVESVTSALRRARATLGALPSPADCAPAPGSPAEQALVARFVRAYESGDVAALVSLLTADVRVSMPPVPLQYRGRDLVARFFASVLPSGGSYDLVPTRANGQPAFGAYRRTSSGVRRRGAGLLVLTLEGDRIAALTRFDSDVLARFGLPSSLPLRRSEHGAGRER
jgi:RNA polymerase sigma-70 factor (ECF subfamily)